jgi:hypothetical protein
MVRGKSFLIKVFHLPVAIIVLCNCQPQTSSDKEKETEQTLFKLLPVGKPECYGHRQWKDTGIESRRVGAKESRKLSAR